MAGKIYIVEGRQFKSDAEYKQALKDQETIEELREKMKSADLAGLKEISRLIEKGKYRFNTILGEDFVDELDDAIKKTQRNVSAGKDKAGKEKPGREKLGNDKAGKNTSDGEEADFDKPVRKLADDERPRRRDLNDIDDDDERSRRRKLNDVEDDDERPRRRKLNDIKGDDESELTDAEIEAEARKILKHRDIRRRVILILSVGIGVLSIAVFIFLAVTNSTIFSKDSSLYQLRDKADKERGNSRVQDGVATDDEIVIHYTETNNETPDILPEFQEMLNINSKLIGWLTIEGTSIDYPVAQTVDNEYYLTHDLYQNYDRNGTIFMDCNCDVLKPSTNLILYGHHMQSGKMFGNLVKYEDENYYKKHKYITFDTIYERGTYQVMYVFRSHVYEETEIVFKYYQFYDAYSEIEFDSYMNEMAEMSLYDTGVTAAYGDRLLTLSTCDYQEENGRFVVVAKKVN